MKKQNFKCYKQPFLKINIISNFIIFIMMQAALLIWIFIEKRHWTQMKYFTWQSNILLGFYCLIYGIYLCTVYFNKKDPKLIPEVWRILKLSFVVLTTITWITIFLASPIIITYFPDVAKKIFSNSSLIYHVVAPITALLLYVILEYPIKNKHSTWYVLIYITIYGIFYVSIAYTHIDPSTGKPFSEWDWYRICSISPWLVPFLFAIICAASGGISKIVYLLNKKFSENKLVFSKQNKDKKIFNNKIFKKEV